jgi:anti-sigma regulatory factor (Ser/Thr protein kinase)
MPKAEPGETLCEARLVLNCQGDALAELAGWVAQFSHSARLPKEVAFALDLALTEWVTNVRDYGYGNGCSGSIAIQLAATLSSVSAEVSDDAAPFNPLDRPEVDTTLPMEDKPIGGLGIHMIRKFMDELSYDRVEGKNRLAMKKYFARHTAATATTANRA